MERIGPYFYKMSGSQKVKFAEYKCNCGKNFICRVSSINTGRTKSCGCLHIKSISSHSLSKRAIYQTWSDIKQRCFNKKNKYYHNYGGRGITICERWLDFKIFYEDMGDQPPKMTIDRIDNDGNYCKENCKWSTYKEQERNKRTNRNITIN